MSEISSTKPNINVTPLIDVLLVLLIIFMLISPLKPARFETNVPKETKEDSDVRANPKSLVVSVNTDLSLNINNEKNFGTVSDPTSLIERLSQTFADRSQNGILRSGTNEIEKTVFIKAPREIRFGQVAKVVDAVKQSGANPIALQIDKLE